MSDIRWLAIGLGILLVAAVWGFNRWQLHKLRRQFDPVEPVVPQQRVEPVLGDFRELAPDAAPSLSPTTDKPPRAPEPSLAPETIAALPAGAISQLTDSVCLILTDSAMSATDVDRLIRTVNEVDHPFLLEALVGGHWKSIGAGSPIPAAREWRVGVQLASRGGAARREDIEAVQHAVRQFAESISAVVQCEDPSISHERARELDSFCESVDVAVAVNVTGTLGATFSRERIAEIADNLNLSETLDGYCAIGRDGVMRFRVNMDTNDHVSYVKRLTFVLDVPTAEEGGHVWDDMVTCARRFATETGGELVDDAGKPLGAVGLATLKQSITNAQEQLAARGIPAGSVLARRLFT